MALLSGDAEGEGGRFNHSCPRRKVRGRIIDRLRVKSGSKSGPNEWQESEDYSLASRHGQQAAQNRGWKDVVAVEAMM